MVSAALLALLSSGRQGVLVKLERVPLQQHVGHLDADHAPSRRVSEVNVVKVADERRGVGRRESAELGRVAGARAVVARVDGIEAVFLLEPPHVLREGLGALESRVTEGGVLLAGVHRFFEGLVDFFGFVQEFEVAAARRLPLGPGGRGGLPAALLRGLVLGVELHRDEAHLLDEA